MYNLLCLYKCFKNKVFLPLHVPKVFQKPARCSMLSKLELFKLLILKLFNHAIKLSIFISTVYRFELFLEA